MASSPSTSSSPHVVLRRESVSLVTSAGRQRVHYTRVEVSKHGYVAIGTSTGSVFVFASENGQLHFLKIISTGTTEAVSRLAFNRRDGDADLLAVGTASGSIFVIDSKLSQSLKESTKVVGTVSLHKASVSCLLWSSDGSRLFSADESGLLACSTRAIQLPFNLFRRSEILLRNDAAVVQLEQRGHVLLCSTLTRCLLLDLRPDASHKAVQVGKKLRNGRFGACFDPTDASRVLAARPGRRLWLAGALDGQVVSTYRLSMPSHAHVFDPERGGYADLSSDAVDEKAHKRIQFLSLVQFKGLIVTWVGSSLVFLNVMDVDVPYWFPHFYDILDVAAHGDDLFVLHLTTEKAKKDSKHKPRAHVTHIKAVQGRTYVEHVLDEEKDLAAAVRAALRLEIRDVAVLSRLGEGLRVHMRESASGGDGGGNEWVDLAQQFEELFERASQVEPASKRRTPHEFPTVQEPEPLTPPAQHTSRRASEVVIASPAVVSGAVPEWADPTLPPPLSPRRKKRKRKRKRKKRAAIEEEKEEKKKEDEKVVAADGDDEDEAHQPSDNDAEQQEQDGEPARDDEREDVATAPPPTTPPPDDEVQVEEQEAAAVAEEDAEQPLPPPRTPTPPPPQDQVDLDAAYLGVGRAMRDGAGVDVLAALAETWLEQYGDAYADLDARKVTTVVMAAVEARVANGRDADAAALVEAHQSRVDPPRVYDLCVRHHAAALLPLLREFCPPGLGLDEYDRLVPHPPVWAVRFFFTKATEAVPDARGKASHVVSFWRSRPDKERRAFLEFLLGRHHRTDPSTCLERVCLCLLVGDVEAATTALEALAEARPSVDLDELLAFFAEESFHAGELWTLRRMGRVEAALQRCLEWSDSDAFRATVLSVAPGDVPAAVWRDALTQLDPAFVTRTLLDAGVDLDRVVSEGMELPVSVYQAVFTHARRRRERQHIVRRILEEIDTYLWGHTRRARTVGPQICLGMLEDYPHTESAVASSDDVRGVAALSAFPEFFEDAPVMRDWGVILRGDVHDDAVCVCCGRSFSGSALHHEGKKDGTEKEAVVMKRAAEMQKKTADAVRRQQQKQQQQEPTRHDATRASSSSAFQHVGSRLAASSDDELVVLRCGHMFHVRCRPADGACCVCFHQNFHI